MTIRYTSDAKGIVQVEGVPTPDGLSSKYLEMIARHSQERHSLIQELKEAGWVEREYGSWEDAGYTYLSPALLEAEKKGTVEIGRWGQPEQPGWEGHYIV